ncbi:MAG: lytic transglycosylase domain-containing protein [Deltaproteobacteria bacterium]|nr:lytic transglycosylase domain-containing protein [Candidatus Tharpella sp.]
MGKKLLFITGFAIFLLIFWSDRSGAKTGTDPWIQLRQTFPTVKTSLLLPQSQKKVFAANDPWQRLRHVVIPFTIDDERALLAGEDEMSSSPIKKKLASWSREIENAATFFQIPRAIIEAVIMVESGGNPRAKAQTSTASGMMQTIKSTFSEARRALLGQGIIIADNPFDPYASIMAGSWYLDKMFVQARADGKTGMKTRTELSAWRYPLEYYYAGPGHGRKAEPRILIYSGGKRLLIDKPAYSQKVLGWAAKLG